MVLGAILADMPSATTFVAFLGAVLIDLFDWGDVGFGTYHSVGYR